MRIESSANRSSVNHVSGDLPAPENRVESKSAIDPPAASEPPEVKTTFGQRMLSWVAWNVPRLHALYARLAVKALNDQFREEAEAIGYVASFEPPPGWIPGTRQSMTGFWQDMAQDGKEAPEGVNLYSLGGPSASEPGFMARVDPESPDYQAWVGVYVCNKGGSRFWNRDQVDLNQVVELALHDQRAWLRGFGDPEPKAGMLWSTDESGKPLPASTEIMTVDGAQRTAYILDIESHSDVFDPEGGINPFQSFMGHTGRIRSTSAAVDSSVSVVPPAAPAPPYEPVILRAYYVPFWVDREQGVYAVAYACGTIERFDAIKDKLRRSLESMHVEPVGTE